MSVAAMSWAWKLELQSTEKYLLVALCDHANDEDFTCYPSLNHLEIKTGLARTTIWRVIDRLVELNLIERLGGSKAGSTLYKVKVGAQRTQVQSAPRCTEEQGRCTESTEVGAQKNKVGAQRTPNHHESSLNHQEPSCVEPQGSPLDYTLPLNDKSEYSITKALAIEFQGLYPGITVLDEIKKMRAWCLSNPTKRKTKRGILRFMNNWLANEQDKGKQREANRNIDNSAPGKVRRANAERERKRQADG